MSKGVNLDITREKLFVSINYEIVRVLAVGCVSGDFAAFTIWFVELVQ